MFFDSPNNVYFAEILVFGDIFWFSGDKLGQKMDKKFKLWLHPVSVEIHFLKMFMKNCFLSA